jgi:hypothetical protein
MDRIIILHEKQTVDEFMYTAPKKKSAENTHSEDWLFAYQLQHVQLKVTK